ncbi:MAG: hypothetical protein TREMPRED_005217 [Tremellales sp. Tagirdzhanova-0007]|nr:MAG: hypothetical protein TREMPRED_005217 [Tremellales sp. Tagirdzhanova-0007]
MSTMSYHLTPIQSRPQPTRHLSHQPLQSRPSPYPNHSPRRPGGPQRAHSFCGNSSTSTYALASTCNSSHLTPDKRQLVAPPLERTLSSTGSRGNHSSPAQQMARPKIVQMERYPSHCPMRGQSPPQSPVPTIRIQSMTPPRPSISTLRSSSSTSTLSSSSDTTLPSTPISPVRCGRLIAEEDEWMDSQRGKAMEDVVRSVGELMVE